MSKHLRVRLKLSLLILHLSREDGRKVSKAEVIQWLKDAGFKPSSRGDDYWYCLEADLGHLDPFEVLEIEDVPDGSPLT